MVERSLQALIIPFNRDVKFVFGRSFPLVRDQADLHERCRDG